MSVLVLWLLSAERDIGRGRQSDRDGDGDADDDPRPLLPTTTRPPPKRDLFKIDLILVTSKKYEALQESVTMDAALEKVKALEESTSRSEGALATSSSKMEELRDKVLPELVAQAAEMKEAFRLVERIEERVRVAKDDVAAVEERLRRVREVRAGNDLSGRLSRLFRGGQQKEDVTPITAADALRRLPRVELGLGAAVKGGGSS